MNLTEYGPTLSGKVNNFYSGKKAVLVTEHYKQTAIQNILQSSLGLIITPMKIEDIESVQASSSTTIPLQYKSGEKARKLAQTAMSLTNSSIGIATSSYWGQDTVAGHLNLLSETIAFVDDDLEICIYEKLLSYQMLDQEASLEHAWEGAVGSEEPYRKIVTRLVTKLGDRMSRSCPDCTLPGWGILLHKQGLACRNCGLPTSAPLSNIWYCTSCNHTMEEMVQEKGKADPEICHYCN